jgi:hypothetical protein
LPDWLADLLVSEIEQIAASDAFRGKLELLGVTSAAARSRISRRARSPNGAGRCRTHT